MIFPKEKLSNICLKITDGSHNPPKGVELSEYLMFSSKNVNDDNLTYDSPRYLTKEDFDVENRRTQVAPNDVLLTIVGTIGRCAVVPANIPNICLQRSVAVLKPNHDKVLSRFLMYSLMSMLDYLNSRARGVAQKGIYLETIRDLTISLPPLRIQKIMVAKLDAIFHQIEKAKVASEINSSNADALFQSYLSNVFEDNKSSKIYRLDDVVTRLTNGYVGATKNIYLDSGIPYLLARHVKNNVLTFDERTFISEEFNMKNKKSILKKDDVLLVQSGHIGHSAVVPLEHEGHNCHAMIVITTVKKVLSGEFLSLYFQSNKMKSMFEKMRTGSTIKHLNCGDVKLLSIPIPSLEIQNKIILKSEKIKKLLDSVRGNMFEKSIQLQLLRKAILSQAFNGELVKE